MASPPPSPLLRGCIKFKLACAQVLEVVAEEKAEELSYMELLGAHPAEGEEASQTQKSPQSKLGAAKQQVTVQCPALLCDFCPAA